MVVNHGEIALGHQWLLHGNAREVPGTGQVHKQLFRCDGEGFWEPQPPQYGS